MGPLCSVKMRAQPSSKWPTGTRKPNQREATVAIAANGKLSPAAMCAWSRARMSLARFTSHFIHKIRFHS